VSVVSRVRAFPVQYIEPNNDGKLRSLTLVAVDTDDGATGWGEAISGTVETSLAVAFLAERRLAPMIQGRDPRDVRQIWQDVRDATFWDGNGGVLTFAHSAIDMALWDLAGIVQDRPLYELLGGRRTDQIRACASTIFATGDLERIRSEYAGFAAEGYTAVKGGWGHDLSIAFGRDATRDLAVAHAVRDAVGPEVDVICDVVALAGWTAEHGIDVARRLADEVGLFWLEDPFHEEDLVAYRALKDALPDLRICTGEKGWIEPHYRRLVASGVDVVMLDPGRAEGVTGTWNVIEMAREAGRSWNAHSWSSAVNTAASLHMAAASSNVLVLELKPVPSPMQDDIVRTPIRQAAGYLAASDRPGLGVEVDESAVRSFVVSA
jgi:L-alanine-DL-glutamate epimerase-like enolase superfamily enzyme